MMASPKLNRLTRTNKTACFSDRKVILSGCRTKEPKQRGLRLPILVLFFTTLFGWSIASTYAEPRWYVGGSVGSVGFSEFSATDSDGASSQLDLDHGVLVSGAIGARFADFFRGELEVSHRKNSVDDFSFNNVDIPGVSGSYNNHRNPCKPVC